MNVSSIVTRRQTWHIVHIALEGAPDLDAGRVRDKRWHPQDLRIEWRSDDPGNAGPWSGSARLSGPRLRQDGSATTYRDRFAWELKWESIGGVWASASMPVWLLEIVCLHPPVPWGD